MRQECRISIITVNYNGLNETCSMLDSIASVGNTMEVIVVDNASFADEATEIEKRYPWVRVIRNSVNSGFAGGNNVGIREAHGRYLFLVNNDTVFDPTGLSALADRMDKSPHYQSQAALLLRRTPHSVFWIYTFVTTHTA